MGGLRIAPRDRIEAPGYDNDREALRLALKMREKIDYALKAHIGGPLGLRALERGQVVGAKFVVLPHRGARFGEPRDRELLDFIVEALNRFERETGVKPVTGQDLGHTRRLSFDSSIGSLDYISARCRGCGNVDTSVPTGVGNFWTLKG
ncbi:MAG: hypothetical protein D6808_05665, partial [Candidatus Dadabacteria bacterium]